MRRIFFSLVLLALFLLPAAPAFAQGGPGGGNGRVIIGQDFTLKSGDTINGDLVVIGGQVVIEQGAAVYGDAVVIGGSLSMNGEATGNAVVIGGVVNLGSQSSVAGDLVTIGGTLSRADGSKVGGNVVTNLPPPQIRIPVAPTAPQAEIPPALPQPGAPVFGFAGRVGLVVVEAIFLAVLALTLTLFLHPQLDRVAETIVRQPVLDGALGLLSIVALVFALLILAVLSLTIILAFVTIPVAFILLVLLGLAWLFGVIALGMEVGDRLKKALHTTWEPALSAGLGTFALVIVVGGIGLVPCLGTLASALVGFVGLGAAVITMFGTRPVSFAAPLAPAAPTGTETSLPPAS